MSKTPFQQRLQCGLTLSLALIGFSIIAQTSTDCNDNLTSYFVSTIGSDETGDGTIAAPFQSLQHAINLACSGDSILMFPGTYYENISVPTHHLTIGGLGLLNGSYQPEITIVDGQDLAVAFHASGDTLTLADFTIQHGRAPNGAGLTLSGSHHSHVHHMIIRDNTGTGDITAHGINLGSSHVVIEHSLITGNYGRKHTISVSGSNNVIRNCRIVDNNTWEYGGGIVSSSSNLLVENCLIANNNNGGLAVQYTTCNVVNCTILNNTNFGVRLRTGGSHAEVHLMNTVLDNQTNLSISQSGVGTGHFVARNSLIPGGSNYSWASTYSTFDFDESVIDDTPYLNETGYPHEYSPAIGSGANEIVWPDGSISMSPTIDLDLDQRPVPLGSLPDMGCFEHPLGNPQPLILGCTDPTACNYNALAIEEDSSCQFPGCLDDTACNYDPSASCDGGTCQYGEPQCNDSYACNYVPDAACGELDVCDYSCCPGPGCCGPGTLWSGNECIISENCRYDFDLSGSVNLPDLLDFLAHFQTSCGVE